jgi:hypothetical protein
MESVQVATRATISTRVMRGRFELGVIELALYVSGVMSVNRIHRPNEQNGSTVRTYCVDPLRLRQNNKQSNNRSNDEPEYSEEFWRKGGSWEVR